MMPELLDDWLSRAAGLDGVHVEPLALDMPFEDLAARFAPRSGTVVLLSGGELDCSRYHLLGVMPWLTLSASATQTRLEVDGSVHTSADSPFRVLRSVLERFELGRGPLLLPMAAGLMGYLSYDLKDCLETLPRTCVDDLQLPQMLLYAPSVLVVHDKLEAVTRLMVMRRSGSSTGVDALLSNFRRSMAQQAPARSCEAGGAGELRSNFTREGYEAAVRDVIDYIAAGDAYQVNLSQRFQVPFSGDGYALFRRLYEANPAPFFAFVQAGDHQVISTSPERFLLNSGRRVEARPIKGTRPRGAAAAEDRALREELAASGKDDAELSMIVDLLRNDIGKVCRAGSVRVTEHKRMEAYRNVYHLVSLVEGELDPGRDAVDLVEAAFPGGSITGCPKVRAMEIIDELESARRHVYCGSIGYFSFHRTMDLSIAIRTAVLLNGILSFSVGGGIVYDSDPAAEYEETLHKGRTLSTACSGGTPGGPARTVWLNGRLMPADDASISVDDQGLLYGNGFFETIRCDDGAIALLGDHLERFRRTWDTLMPGPPPDLSWEPIIARVLSANGLDRGCAAIKLLATRGSRTDPPWDGTLLVTARPYVHRLEAIRRDGLRLGIYPHPRQTPLADHKTLNYLYYLRAGQWAAEHGFDEALILNPDGSVSETNTANLLLVNGREVVRPASPAVLPGVMTGAVCRELESMGYTVTSRPLEQDGLLTAERLLAANALMGAVPVTDIDNRPLSQADPLWQTLNDRIIPGWRKKD
jgi:para-aminobenzoate synthetase component 1